MMGSNTNVMVCVRGLGLNSALQMLAVVLLLKQAQLHWY